MPPTKENSFARSTRLHHELARRADALPATRALTWLRENSALLASHLAEPDSVRIEHAIRTSSRPLLILLERPVFNYDASPLVQHLCDAGFSARLSALEYGATARFLARRFLGQFGDQQDLWAGHDDPSAETWSKIPDLGALPHAMVLVTSLPPDVPPPSWHALLDELATAQKQVVIVACPPDDEDATIWRRFHGTTADQWDVQTIDAWLPTPADLEAALRPLLLPLQQACECDADWTGRICSLLQFGYAVRPERRRSFVDHVTESLRTLFEQAQQAVDPHRHIRSLHALDPGLTQRERTGTWCQHRPESRLALATIDLWRRRLQPLGITLTATFRRVDALLAGSALALDRSPGWMHPFIAWDHLEEPYATALGKACLAVDFDFGSAALPEERVVQDLLQDPEATGYAHLHDQAWWPGLEPTEHTVHPPAAPPKPPTEDASLVRRPGYVWSSGGVDAEGAGANVEVEPSILLGREAPHLPTRLSVHVRLNTEGTSGEASPPKVGFGSEGVWVGVLPPPTKRAVVEEDLRRLALIVVDDVRDALQPVRLRGSP